MAERLISRHATAVSPSFWTQERAGPSLAVARDADKGWQAVHQVAVLDLTEKLGGAGLVIGHKSDSRLHLKASDVDRGLSLKAMTDQLGQFEPVGQEAQAEAPQNRYQRPAPSSDLYEAIKLGQAAAVRVRDAAGTALTDRHR